MTINETHDPDSKSWVPSANLQDSDFPIQNLPFGIFSTIDRFKRGGVRIGDDILDILAALHIGLFPPDVHDIAMAAAEPTLNRLVSLGNAPAAKLRAWLFHLLAENGTARAKAESAAAAILVPVHSATVHLPLQIGAFTDFMTSVHHVTAARRSRPARTLNDNFLHLPVAYNSRASSICEDGASVPRPYGQRRDPDGTVVYAPSNQLDFEVEFGAIIGPGNALGTRVAIDDAGDHIFGYLLVNDWSARDIQIWEQRLGPFLGKAFRTSISPWLVTAEALAPFKSPAPARAPGQPRPLPYLDSESHRVNGGLDIQLKGHLSTRRMRESGHSPLQIVASRLLDCSWTFQQMLTHHTSGGCNLQPGDLLASGTVSGPTDDAAGCLFEITAGTLAIELPTGEKRYWLEDGDEFIITGQAVRPGYRTIGFGRCGAEVSAAG
jgi:fumarylacetoacetase